MFAHLIRLSLAACLSLTALSLSAIGQPGGMGIDRATGRIICDNDTDGAMPPRDRDPSYAMSRLWDEMVFGPGGMDECAGKAQDLTPLDGGTWGMSAPFAGTDAAGRSAEFRLYVLSDAYNWTLGSARQIEEAGRAVPLPSLVSSPEFNARFCAAKAAFSLGTASFGGPRATNHRLAGERAETVVGGLSATRATCPAGRIPLLFAVNMGQYARPSTSGDAGAAAQRRVVIVAAENIAIDIDLEQALKAGLAAQDVFGSLSISDYDLFVVDAL